MLAPHPDEVGWLFLDLNSYFASVEQEMRPELRGKPVAVLPVMAETTCCIAASYEAKRYGISTGTDVRKARELCPELQLVEARHELYVEMHYKITKAIETCVPIEKTWSIDEVACRLMGRQRRVENALQLAREVKRTIYKDAGEMLRCSIGLASNSFLAKVASDMQKPDGLTALTLRDLPQALFRLDLDDIAGIGHRMLARLQRRGIYTVEQLCAQSKENMRAIWGGVVGERFWYWLRGVDFNEIEHAQSSMGHQHVLPPELRSMGSARAVGQKLLQKVAARMRRHKLWARGLSVYVSFGRTREKPIWECHGRIFECQDTTTLLEVYSKMWQSCPTGKPTFIGVTLYDLVPDSLHIPSLMQQEETKRVMLSQTLDRINTKYGSDTLYFGGIHAVRQAAPTRIAFRSIPEFD